MFGIHGHSLRLPVRPIKGHASFKLWQPCADNQPVEWRDLAAEISFAIQSRSALSVQFDTQLLFSLHLSSCGLFLLQFHFPGLSFHSFPFFLSKQYPAPTLMTFRQIFLGSSKALDYIVAAPWGADAPSNTRVQLICCTWDKLLFHLENNRRWHLAGNPCHVVPHVSLWSFSANTQFSMKVSMTSLARKMLGSDLFPESNGLTSLQFAALFAGCSNQRI